MSDEQKGKIDKCKDARLGNKILLIFDEFILFVLSKTK